MRANGTQKEEEETRRGGRDEKRDDQLPVVLLSLMFYDCVVCVRKERERERWRRFITENSAGLDVHAGLTHTRSRRLYGEKETSQWPDRMECVK